MALKGNLRDFSTTQLLNLINLARKTGMLTVEGNGQARMAFREGKLVYACAGGESENTLVEVLHEKHNLSDDHYELIRARAQGLGDKQLGHLLIQAGYVTQSEIVQSVRQHTLDAVYRVFSWTEGLFRFDANQVPPKDKITVPIDLESVIMEGSRRMKEWERLQDEIPDLDISLQFADSPDARLRNVHLTVEEWRVVAFVNPANTIRQIARGNNLSDFQIRRIVYGLLQAGLVRVVPKPRPQPASATPADSKLADQGKAESSQISPTVKRSLVARLIERIKRL